MHMKKQEKTLSAAEAQALLNTLQKRFESNMKRHPDQIWAQVFPRLEKAPDKLVSLHAMEASGGEPDLIGYDAKTGEYHFCDCSAESPAGRRSLCYDRAGLDSRKEFKPENTAVDLASEMGIELLNETQYRHLQTLGKFDAKTSSWLQTPAEIRKMGGAIFGDYRYGQVFVYHNGAQSYYAGRAFRGLLRV